jgi:hypothetical protein
MVKNSICFFWFAAIVFVLSACSDPNNSGSGPGGTGPLDGDLNGAASEEIACLEDTSLASLDTAKKARYFSWLERYI